ncbi:MAG: hypothetical protein IPQ25_17500 [Chitinophagaceae bacterium]|nr:hypothetical protein [Chitinophagaceae bacterium]
MHYLWQWLLFFHIAKPQNHKVSLPPELCQLAIAYRTVVANLGFSGFTGFWWVMITTPFAALAP